MNYKLVLVLAILLGLACGNSSTTGQSSGGEQEEPKAEAAPASYGLNQDVQVGDIRWKFLEVADLGNELKSDNEFIEAKNTSGKFIQIKFEVENQGTEAASYAGIELVDDKGRTFKTYSEKVGFVENNELCILEQLNPNISKTCTEIFEVPGDAAGIKASVGDLSLLGGDEARIDLGL